VMLHADKAFRGYKWYVPRCCRRSTL
jgi:hypothetical protein